MGGWWRWALFSPDGVAPSQMVCVSASINLPLRHKVQKFSSGTGSTGWSGKKGRKTVVVVVWYWVDLQLVHRFRCCDNIAPNAKCQRVLVLALCLVTGCCAMRECPLHCQCVVRVWWCWCVCVCVKFFSTRHEVSLNRTRSVISHLVFATPLRYHNTSPCSSLLSRHVTLSCSAVVCSWTAD